MRLKGLIVPLITPLNPDESLDEDGLERIVEYVIEGGVNGIFVLGSSGELPSLRRETSERLVSAVRAQIGRRDVSLLVGIGDAGTRRTIERGKRLARLGADAAVVTAPYYYWHSQAELYTHYVAVARALDVGTILYNIPHFVKVSLHPETVASLAQEPGIIGIKDSAGDMVAFREYVKVGKATPHFSVCQGAEKFVAESILMGADGLVLGLANIAPQLCRAIYDAAQEGDQARVSALNEKLLKLYAINEYKSFLAGLKVAAHLLGLCRSQVSAPFASLDEGQIDEVRGILSALRLLEEDDE